MFCAFFLNTLFHLKEIVSSRFAEHVRTVHRKERPHSCDECNKAFTKAKDLKNHKRSHTGDRPFVCKQCGARFAISHQLTRFVSFFIVLFVMSGERDSKGNNL